MNKKKFVIGSAIIGGALSISSLFYANSKLTKKGSNDSSYEAIDKYIDEQRHRLNIPGISLAIVEGDKIVHFRGFGKARPAGEAPTAKTPFFIGSLTKSITALAIMQLVEAGKVDLDSPVQRYLPWFRVADPEASTKMKVLHLLNHTSGLSVLQGQMVLSEMDDTADATELQLRALATVKLSHSVGSTFEYNNTNYNILGLIVEAASRESYPDYVQNHIFNPLGMTHSYCSREAAKLDGLAMGYRYWFGQPIPAPNLSIPLGSLPSGQLISCAEDMAHFLIAQLNSGCYRDVQVLSKPSVAEMHKGTIEMFVMGASLGYYAMGWETHVKGNSTIVSHSGIVPDFGAFAGLVPEQNKGIILLYNANHAMMKITFDEFGMGAVERLAGEVPSKAVFGWAPWLMRSMALIPLAQVGGVLLTFKQLERWKADPTSQPTGMRLWGRHIILPLIPNVLASLMLLPMLGKMSGWVKLFMPDFSRIAQVSGGFAVIWSFLRSGMVLRTLRRKRF